MRIHNPPHPGEVLRELCLKPLGLTVTRAAVGLGVSRSTLSAIVNGRTGITPEMALRLSIAFDTTAESWLNHQVHYDLWHVEKQRKTLQVMKFAGVMLQAPSPAVEVPDSPGQNRRAHLTLPHSE